VLPLIKLLLDSGALVVCAGGGGIPVVAEAVDADALLLTDAAAALLDRTAGTIVSLGP
jgi:carbamate kinase